MPNLTVMERQVKRFYYARKGYTTRLGAFKAMAKDELFTQLFGAHMDLGDGETFSWHGRPGLQRPDDVPHHAFDEKAVFAAKMREFGFECDEGNRWDGEPEYCCPETYAFCGRKFKEWVKARAYELMKAGAE